MKPQNCILSVTWLLLCVGCALHRPPTKAETPPTSAKAGETTIVAIAPPAKSHPTLCDCLGVHQAYNCLAGAFNQILSELGICYPDLEPKPPLKPIADPENAESPNPAVSTAAKIKAEEDGARQKIKALRYLATIGCAGCYPGVEEAFLAALDDCTEAVRFEAVKGLRSAAGRPCKLCKTRSCCGPNVIRRLNQVAYGVDDTGCYNEPSARVRRYARLALCACSGTPVEEPQLPEEGPSEEIPTEGSAEGPRSDGAARQTQEQTEGESNMPLNVQERPSTLENEPSGRVDAKFRGSVMPTGLQQLIDSLADREPAPHVRWELVSAPFARFDRREDARATIEFIRQQSLGVSPAPPSNARVNAVATETYGWTNPEELPTGVIARALAQNSVGVVSPVLEDDSGVYLIRVLERRTNDGKMQ